MDDKEIELLMAEMKADGKSDEEIGYAVSKAIYGEDSTLAVLCLFEEGIKWAEAQSPGDGFVEGSRQFLKEQLRKYD